jgi:hypothetical protein
MHPNVETFYTLQKYVDIVVNTLISSDKLFHRYISISHGPSLLRIMDGFFYACGSPNVYGAIDGSHISLSQKLDNSYCNTYRLLL